MATLKNHHAPSSGEGKLDFGPTDPRRHPPRPGMERLDNNEHTRAERAIAGAGQSGVSSCLSANDNIALDTKCMVNVVALVA